MQSGHSKWHNTRHQKARKDLSKCKEIHKHLLKIRTAILENGGVSDPRLNIKLEHAIKAAKHANVQGSTIENAIKSVSENRENGQQVWFDVKGPKGIAMLVLTLTSKQMYMRHVMKGVLKKTKGLHLAASGLRYLFQHKGLIIAKSPFGTDPKDGKCVDDAIEAGADEVEALENDPTELKFLCNAYELNKVTTELKSRNYTIISSEEEYIPNSFVHLTDEELNDMNDAYDKLRNMPEVVKIFDNVAS